MKTSISNNSSASLNTNIVFYREWYDAIAILPEELQNVAYKALFDRAFIGKEPDNVLLGALISIMMSTIDRTRTKYERKAEGRTRGRKPKGVVAPEVPEDEVPEDESVDEYIDAEPEADEEALTEITPDQQRDMELRAQFEAFRKDYPGSKRGFDVEFKNLQARTAGKWREVIPLLSKGLEREQAWREELRKANHPIPTQACLQTWINNSRWESEYPVLEPAPAPQPEQPHVETRRERERRERDEHDRLVAEYRQEYRRRVSGAFTDRAPITYSQYMINHCYDMSDAELDRFLSAPA